MTHLTTESWSRLQALFEQAVALDPAQRAGFVSEHCVGDPILQSQLWKMIAANEQADGMLDAPLTPESPEGGGEAAEEDARRTTLVGRRIGQFTVTRLIAAGGMATVYEAMQQHPQRIVALKVMSRGLSSRAARRRFEFETEVLGRLQHPAITQIHEAGVLDSDEGAQPFFAMELIRGLPLTEYPDAHKLGTRERLVLITKVCDGVEHAHRNGVVHRDLKPSNILVDESGQPKILDFGIARSLDADHQSTTLRTDVGQMIGTLPYMSPEQVVGSTAEVPGGRTLIDARSDVYALGVIAFELLTGSLPHDLAHKSLPEAARVIREDDPPRLSSMNPYFRGDLDTIVSKALEKDRNRRYASVAEFAGDIRRYLNDEAVLARRASALYTLGKFARRHKALVAGVCAVFAVLVLGVAGTTWQWRRAVVQRDHARAAEIRATTSLEHAWRSASSMNEFAEQYLSNLAGATASRERLARMALEYALRLTPDDPRARGWELGYAHQRLGDVQLVKGKTAEALATYQIATAVRQEAVEAQPDSLNQRRALAVSHWKIADTLFVMGRFEECLEHNRLSLELIEQIEREQRAAGEKPPSGYTSFAHRRLADVLAMLQRPDEALVHYQAGLDTLDLPNADAETLANKHYHRGHANVLRGFGEFYNAAGRHEEALRSFDACLAVLERLAAESGPMNVYERTNQSRVLLGVAAAQVALSRSNEAFASAQRAVEISESLSAADRDHAESQHIYGHCLMGLAQTYLAIASNGEIERREAARDAARRALEVLTPVTANDPENFWAARDLAAARDLLAK